jgi:hypothetical protein
VVPLFWGICYLTLSTQDEETPTLQMVVASSSKMLAHIHQITQCHIPEDHNKETTLK